MIPDRRTTCGDRTLPKTLLDYFNAGQGGTGPLRRYLDIRDGRALGYFSGLHLHSVFQPLLDAATLRPVAHEALLRAKGQDGTPVPVDHALGRAKTKEEVIYLDRLCRVMHAVNFAYQDHGGGSLFLNIDGRHLLSVEVERLGIAFEGLLRQCGLKPTQVVLEIIESRIDDLDRLIDAAAAYQERGYRVAIDDFGCQHSNFDRLWQLSPDIVKLDRSLIVQAATRPRARLILPKLVEIIHDLGALAVCEGIETAEQHTLATDSGVDLLQGYFYARPAPELLGNLAGPPITGNPIILRPGPQRPAAPSP